MYFMPWCKKCVHLYVYDESSFVFVFYRIQIFDASLCGVSASGDALQRFFAHSLTQTLTYKPRFTGTDK